jgi:AcrR family transcriptional regulator
VGKIDLYKQQRGRKRMARARKATSGEMSLREEQNKERRGKILQALHRCISKRGFSRSSLTDIAIEAGMSPSHIRYYFEG